MRLKEKGVATEAIAACGVSQCLETLRTALAISAVFSVADYGLEADLFTAVPELVSSL